MEESQISNFPYSRDSCSPLLCTYRNSLPASGNTKRESGIEYYVSFLKVHQNITNRKWIKG